MPFDDPDPEAPSVLIGIGLPAGPEAVREMAYAFAEEFAAHGYDEERLLSLFRQPFYAGAHGALKVLGEAQIQIIVRESVATWGGWRVKIADSEVA